MAKIRTFIAVELSQEARRATLALQGKLAAVAPTSKWVPQNQFHVTLAFLGEVSDKYLGDIFNTLAKAARTESPFRLSLAGVSAFPNIRRPNTVWAGLSEGAEELTRIHTALEEPLTDLGLFRREDRGYTPHVTLGRVAGEEDEKSIAAMLPTLKDWTAGESYISELVAFSSEIRKEGPEYSVMGRSPLSKRKG